MDQTTHDSATLSEQVINACHAMGFALAGIAPAAPASRPTEFKAWLASGNHGDMDYMAEAVNERLDIRTLLPGAKSVIIVADQYAARGSEPVPPVAAALGGNRCDHPTHPTGRIAKYARGRDYHAVIRRRLHALADRLRELPAAKGLHYRTFVDTAPVLEREHAARANLRTADGGGGAFIGKHTLLIHPRLGSYLLLGGIATTLDLCSPHSALGTRHSALTPCGTCTRCIDACPTQAITPNHVNATRCISYLTLEHRTLIDPALHAAMGDHLLGCDICQDVCPFNHPHPSEHAGAYLYPAYADEHRRASPPILEVLNWTEADRTRVLGTSAAKRASLSMLKRNAIIAAANALASRPDENLRSALTRLAADPTEHPLVRETADQARARLRS
ncbi:MAG TPA: tRNA epoxyqueuosine(34) reductase QueG [Phycisphaerales bacterium]|nr:tRNA epoxyqueuosine(34) reductase QueG [Phycisphaerales bacterium]